MIKKLFDAITGGAHTKPMATTRQEFNKVYSLEAPAIYTRNDKYNMLQLIDPKDELAVITASAYEKQDGSLDEFSEYRFGRVEDIYKPVTDIQTFAGEYVVGKLQEFEGTYPDESEPTYFVATAIATGNIFISLSLITTREHYTSYRSQYDAILESIQPCA